MKKYEITEKQIRKIAVEYDKIREMFPEVFEKELEVGKWYISEYYLVYYLGNYKCNCIELSNGEWIENVYHSLSGHLKSYRLATEEEVKEALINESIKRGYKKGVKCAFGTDKYVRFLETNKFNFDLKYNMLSIKDKNGNADIIFKNGKWAEIIKEYIPTQEEIDRVINYLKNK